MAQPRTVAAPAPRVQVIAPAGLGAPRWPRCAPAASRRAPRTSPAAPTT